MANWAAIGALGQAASGAGDYFGIVAADKKKADMLAQARAEKLEDRDYEAKAETARYDRDRADGKADTIERDGQISELETTRRGLIIDEGVDATAAARELGLVNAPEDNAASAAEKLALDNASDGGWRGETWTDPRTGEIFDVMKDGSHRETGRFGDDLKSKRDKAERPPNVRAFRKDIRSEMADINYETKIAASDNLVHDLSQGTQIGDHSGVFSYFNIKDPTSTVRDTEFASVAAANTWFEEEKAKGNDLLAGLPAPVKIGVQKVLGGGMLTPRQRVEMIEITDNLRNETQLQADKIMAAYSSMNAEYGFDETQLGFGDYASGLDEDDVKYRNKILRAVGDQQIDKDGNPIADFGDNKTNSSGREIPADLAKYYKVEKE